MMRNQGAGWRSRAVLGFVTLMSSIPTSGCSPDAGAPSSAGAAGNAGSATGGSAGFLATAGASLGGTAAGSGGSGGVVSAGFGGGTSGSAGAAPDCHQAGAAGPLATRLPCVLSQTGLYGADMTTLSPTVHPFAPSFALWSDGAEKQRWIALPAASKIDTSDMDYWTFPAGTKLWKEFSRDGVRVETRLMEKQASGAWYAVAYQWRSDQKEADAVPNGVVNASGTLHDVPNSDQCLTCHSQLPDKALGFSAIQLSHAKLDPASTLEWTLDTLIADGLLTSPPAKAFTVPGTALERDTFGYLHANCGTCHNPKGSANTQTGLDMWLKVADLSGPVSEFSVYKGLFDQDIVWLDAEHPNAPKRIAPGSLPNSAVYQRFIEKGQTWSMPPLGTEVVDPTGKKLLEDWINSAG